MARMSEEQWKDLKLKIIVGVILLTLGLSAYAVGPGLPKFLDYARKHNKEPWAPKWYYRIAKVMEASWRRDQAQEIYVEFVMTFGDDKTVDFEPGLTYERHPGDHFAYPYYLPWKAHELWAQDKEWPDPVQKADRELLGKVLRAHFEYLEDEKKYPEMRHLLGCIKNMWPPGSPTQQFGELAHIRDATRSF